MNFYKRYAEICAKNGIDPCSKKAAELFKVTKATISSWNKNNSTPKGETVALIAKELNVSSDYLLDLTDSEAQNTELQQDEQELLDLYRVADTDGKNTIYKVAEALGAGKGKDGESGIPEAM